MRIGLVTGEFPPMQGGVGAFTERLAQALAQMGHELHVVSHREARPAPPGDARPPLRAIREPVQTDWGLLHPVARQWGWSDVGKIAQIAIRYDVEILNIQYQAAAYNMRSAAMNLAPWRLRGIAPVVTTFHDLRVPYLFPKAGRLRESAVRLGARTSNGVITTNGEDYSRLQSWLHGRPGRVTQIPIGSNIDRYEPDPGESAAARRRLQLPADAFLIGYFGFLNASKGADLLVEALARLPAQAHLAFVGGQTGSSDHENNRRVVASVDEQARAAGVGERVHWTGFLPDRELSELLQSCDLLAMPYRDGASLRRGTLMAALAHGRPIVTTEPASTVEELVHGRNVWLVARDDAGALADGIRQVWQDAALRRELGAAALQLARSFSWESIAAQTVAFYRELAA